MDFIGKRKFAYALSLIVIAICVGSLFVQGLNFGIDFTGGTLLQIKFADSNITSEDVRGALKDFDLEKSSIQESSDGSFTIRTVELDQARQDQVVSGMKEKIGDFEILRSEKVGPVIGAELRRAGLLALFIASILQIIYITIRFEFKFAIAAILALLHDAIIAVGFFSIFQIEVNSAFIAAILTIIGYSINDTIVIFDRIRENMKKRRKETLAEVVNNSVSQTLVRSINTTVAVLFVLVALFFLGGETTKNFSLALLVGTVSGAYSSIFVASPLWYEFKPERNKGYKKARA